MRNASTSKTLAYIVSSGAAGLIGVAVLPVLTRALTKDEFASYSLVALAVQLFATPGAFGLTAYVTTFVARLHEEADGISRAVADWNVLYIYLALLALVVSPFVTGALWLAPVLVASYSRAWCALGAQTNRLTQKAGWFAFYQVGVPAMFFAILLAVHQAKSLSGAYLYFAGSVATVAGALAAWRQCRSLGWSQHNWRWTFQNKQYIRFAVGAFLHSLAGLALTSWDRIYVASALTSGEFAVYSVAATCSSGLVLMYSAVSQALIPNLYGHLSDTAHRARTAQLYAVKVASLFVACFAAYELLIGVVIQMLLPASYLSAVVLARFLGCAALLQGLYLIVSSVLFFYHRTLTLSFITISCGGLGALLAKASGAATGVQISVVYVEMWGLFFLLTLALALRLLPKDD